MGTGGTLRLTTGYALVILTAIFVTVVVVLHHAGSLSPSAERALPWCLLPLLLLVLGTSLPLPWFEDDSASGAAQKRSGTYSGSQAQVSLLEGGSTMRIDGDVSI